MGWLLSSGVPKLGTCQMPVFKISCQFFPGWISPLTPMLSIIRPGCLGRERSRGGRETGLCRLKAGATSAAGPPRTWARAWEVCGERR